MLYLCLLLLLAPCGGAAAENNATAAGGDDFDDLLAASAEMFGESIPAVPAPVDGAKFRRWRGGVLAPSSGRIYGIPFEQDAVLIIHPNGTADVSSMRAPRDGPAPGSSDFRIDGSAQWHSGVLAPNGKIYGIPHNAQHVLVIDPTSGTAALQTRVCAGLFKWAGGVLASDGRIYAIPHNADGVLVVDPTDDSADWWSMPVGSGGIPWGASPGKHKWEGGVLAPNGLIYGIPARARSVLIIDPARRTVDATSMRVCAAYDEMHAECGAGCFMWDRGVLGPDGRVYGIPSYASSVLIIDPVAGTTDAVTLATRAPSAASMFPPGSFKW